MIISLFQTAIFPKVISAEGSEFTAGITSREIIQQMQNAYGGSDSYRDSGMVREIFSGNDGTRIVEKAFNTAFIRPGQFRFEFQENSAGKREQWFILQRSGDELQTYWDIDPTLQPDSLDRVIAAATGISSDAAITVPAMLLPGEIKWRRAIRFHEPTRGEDDVLDGVDCYRIHDDIFGSAITFWIGKKDFLLRGIYSRKSFEDFTVTRTTVYRPQLNGEVTRDMLEFGGPGS